MINRIEGENMDSNRKSAIIVGILFIITMIMGMINAYFIAPVAVNAPLVDIFPNKILAITGSLLVLGMAIGIVGIAVMLFPILKKYNETIAITYVSFRVIECVLLIVGVIGSLSLIVLSQAYIQAGAPDASYFQTIGNLIIAVSNVAYQIAMVILGLGSMMLCYLLYQTKLIPRFISVWGFIGYVLLLVSALLDIFGVIDTQGVGMIMYLPGTIFELILLPAWLIIKGFNPSAIGLLKERKYEIT